MKAIRYFHLILTCTIVMALLTPWQPVMARAEKALVFTVNTTADTHAVNTASSVCLDASGNCSLRAALETATTKDGVDIYLPSGTYNLTTYDTVNLVGDDDLTQISISQTGGGTLPIITGVNSGSTLTIDGNLSLGVNSVIFTATNPIFVGELGTLSMLNVTLTGMHVSSFSTSGGGGGAVKVTGKAYFTACTFSGNSASNNVNGFGGAIFNDQGFVEIVASTFSDNLADYGGAIYSQTPYDYDLSLMSIKTSTFINNSATRMGGAIHLNGYNRQFGNGHSQVQIEESRIVGNSAPDGGGIFIGSSFPVQDPRDQGGVNIRYSEISDNIAEGNDIYSIPGNGGGIYVKNVANSGGDYSTYIENSTISGNEALYRGGGIYVEQDGGSSIVGYNVTITDNAADRLGDSGGNGGGYYNADSTSVLHLNNSILAANRDLTGGTFPIFIPDCVGKINLGYSLLGRYQNTFCTLDGDSSTSIIGSPASIDPGLSALSDYGQFTWLHHLLISSPAINAANPAGCTGIAGLAITDDQHFSDRPIGSACDMGSAESSYRKLFLPSILR